MSKIEIAMEKAARLRDEAGAPAGAGQAPAVPRAADTREARSRAPLPASQQRLTPVNPFLVNLNEPHSSTAEEYRKLKTMLVKLTGGASLRNTVQVTSALPGEGKSLTALNLALSLAQEFDHTVLLVDADLRRPSVHRYLGLEQGPGLAELLLGEAQVNETLVATGIGSLSLIRAGREVENPAELLGSQKMKEILEELKSRYPDRYVIFDSAPVLPFAEPRSLAQLVDGVLFVVMERLAPQQSVKDALDSLKGSQMLGFVFNAATQGGKHEPYGYYRGYGRKQA